MAYSKRIEKICSYLKAAESFADVGCDHGYCSEYMLKNGLCKRVILSDISKGSLQKAKDLLAEYILDGRAVAVLGDGFVGVPKDTQEVLIAGMGGSEIISILSDERYGFIPEYFVLQPMHDSEKLRRYLVEKGVCILRDFTFFDGKYYDLIVGRRGVEDGATGAEKGATVGLEEYSEDEYEFGRDNLRERGEAFLKRTEKLLSEARKYLACLQLKEDSRLALERRARRLERVLKNDGT